MSLLSVNNLSISFKTRRGEFTAIDKLSFDINRGETLGIVGESGSGKSVTSLALMGLLESNRSVHSGKINFDGQDLNNFSKSEWTKISRSQISMIFQDPMTTLDPCYTVEDQISEVLKIHTKLSPS